jgi:hypothetical protein
LPRRPQSSSTRAPSPSAPDRAFQVSGRINSKTFTYNDGFQTYKCANAARLTIYATTYSGTSTVTCDKRAFEITIGATMRAGSGDFLFKTKTCLVTKSCTVTTSSRNPSGVQALCFQSPNVGLNSEYMIPGSTTVKLCRNS